MRYKINTQEIIFVLVYIIYLIAVVGDYTVFSEYSMCSLAFKLFRYACYLFAIIKVIRDVYSREKILELILVLACVAGSVVFSGNKTFGFYFLIIMAAKDLNARKIIKITCFVQGIYLAICIVLSQLGIIQDYIFDPNARGRHGMGFVWTTTAPILYFFFMMSYVYLRKKKMHTIEFVVLEIINYWLFVLTDARMSFYLSSCMLLFIFVMRFYWENKSYVKIVNMALVLSPIIMCGIAIALHAGYDGTNERWNSLNSLLSGRLSLGYSGLEKYGVTLFGQPIRWIGYSHGAAAGTYNYVDCSYLQILLENGAISLVLVVAAYVYVMYMAVKVKDFYLQTVILFIVVFSITEPRLMNLGFNPFPILAAGFFCNAKEDCFRQENTSYSPQIRWSTPHVTIKKRK